MGWNILIFSRIPDAINLHQRCSRNQPQNSPKSSLIHCDILYWVQDRMLIIVLMMLFPILHQPPPSVFFLTLSLCSSQISCQRFCYGPNTNYTCIVFKSITKSVKDNNHLSILRQRFFVFFHGNEWQGDFTHVQPHRRQEPSRKTGHDQRPKNK